MKAITPVRFPIFNNGSSRNSGQPWFRVRNLADDTVEILIYEQIGKDWWSGDGVGAKEFVEALKAIPRERNILLSINSPGGNVHDGMAIYSQLALRRNRVTVRVDGLAASIASVIALAGKELIMPKNALLMIHDPWAVVAGDADDMRQMADALDVHKDAIVSVYQEATEQDPERIRQWMTEETWFTGDEAVEHGFADRTSDEMSLQASFDLSRFRRVPAALNQKRTSAAPRSEATPTPTPPMNRTRIIALLRKHGIQVADDATNATLLALLAQLPATEQAARTEAEQWLNAQPAPTPTPAPTPAPAPAPTPSPSDARPGDVQAVEVRALREELTQLRNERAADRRRLITVAVDQCVSEDRVPAAERDRWIARCIADDTILADLQARTPQRPGHPPLTPSIEAISADPRNLVAHLSRLRAPITAMLRGNQVSGLEIQRHSMELARLIRQHRDVIVAHLNTQIYNTNTVDADLKRNVILQDIMRAFKRKIVMLGVFSTVYRNVPLEGTDKVTIPFYGLDTTTTKNFSGTYTFDTDTDTGERSVTIDRRKYQPLNFSSSEFRRQPYFRPEINMMLKAEQLALDVWLDVLALVTASNYSTAVLDSVPGSFDTDDMVDLRAAANNADWPDMGRAAVLGTDFEAALLKDDALKHFLNSGSTDPLREGSSGRLLGFDMFYSPRIPANSEDLVGFIALPPAMLVASAPILPAPGVMSQLVNYDVVIEPDLGVAFEYRYWGEPNTDNDREVVEVNYGRAVGNAAALKRIVNTAS